MKNLKLRYYLRGLGIGIFVTVLIVCIGGKTDNTMTDAQVREKALELGMIDADSVVLSKLQGDTAEQQEAMNPEKGAPESTEATSADKVQKSEVPEDTAEELDAGTEEAETGNASEDAGTEEAEAGNASEDAGTEEAEAGNASEDAETKNETEATEEMPEEEMPKDEVAEEAQPVKLEIRSGASSYSVSKDLEKAGLIEDAGDFDDYLCQKGYSKSIRVGTYEIEVGTDEEEIAKIITGKR